MPFSIPISDPISGSGSTFRYCLLFELDSSISGSVPQKQKMIQKKSSLLRSRCLGSSHNALPPPPTAASTRTTFLSIPVANHRVAHIILSQSRQNNSPNHSSRFIGYLWQTKIASLEEAFVSTASKYKMPRSWPYEKIVLLKKVFRLRSTVNLSKICSLKWKFERRRRNRKPRRESAQVCQ